MNATLSFCCRAPVHCGYPFSQYACTHCGYACAPYRGEDAFMPETENFLERSLAKLRWNFPYLIRHD